VLESDKLAQQKVNEWMQIELTQKEKEEEATVLKDYGEEGLEALRARRKEELQRKAWVETNHLRKIEQEDALIRKYGEKGLKERRANIAK